MHSYLRSIGFTDIKKETDIFKYIQMVIDAPDIQCEYKNSDGNTILELKKEFGCRIGLAICGSLEKGGHFHLEYYYPYLQGIIDSTDEDIELEKHIDKNSYAGICDDMRLGITLIYYLQNSGEFLNHSSGKMNLSSYPTMLTAMSIDGKIILPVNKHFQMRRNHLRHMRQRSDLMSAARDGDEDAIESLTMEDIDTYTSLSKRISEEDVYTIVSTSMMPCGIESDQYLVVGDILNIEHSKNKITGDDMLILTINSKDIMYDVCINKKDLLGEAQIGRRFKGTIWMQGQVKF